MKHAWRLVFLLGVALGVMAVESASGGATAAPQSGGTMTRVSVGSDGAEGNDESWEPAISADGRYVAFASYADNLVAGDTNSTSDIFVRDRQAGATVRISVGSSGAQGNGGSWDPTFSTDSRYVAFVSDASNLVTGDVNGVNDIFVHDRQTGQTTLVSRHTNGIQGNGYSSAPSISGDGRYVVFHSGANNLIDNDTNGQYDIFIHDRWMGMTSLISSVAGGTSPGNGRSVSPSISADGRLIAFWSGASNLVSGDTNNWKSDVFLYNRDSRVTTRIPVDLDQVFPSMVAISADGRYVGYTYYADTSYPYNDAWGAEQVVVHDMQTGANTLIADAPFPAPVEAPTAQVALSADGRFVAFSSDIRPDNSYGENDISIFDQHTGQTNVITQQGDGASHSPAVSADGRVVAFSSWASNIVPCDLNGVGDIFVYDRDGETPSVFSVCGTVSMLDGTPLSGVVVGTFMGNTTTDANGRYVLTGLPAGTYDVVPTLAGIMFMPWAAVVDVPPDARGVDFIGTEPSYCASLVPDALDPDVQPLMLINGWEGSVGKYSLAEDEQLSFFRTHLAPHGYVEGCNLFYSTAMSPYNWLAENAVTIRNNMCLARLEVRKWNPSWNGHFSIIGHSYGGLRARAYLENTQLYKTPCSITEGSEVYVDNLFTLGTPHSGEIGDLPFATAIAIKAIWNQEWPALAEMLPPVRVWQNLQQRQSSGTRYIFIGGDTRWQVATSISPLWLVYMTWKPAQKLANDFAVHRLSAFGLGMPSDLYPDVQKVETGDLHVHIPSLDPLGVLESYVNPAATFNQHICGRLGLSGCPSSALNQSAQPSRPNESVMAVVARQQTPTTSAAMPMMEVVAGELAAGETLEGEFELTGSGAWQTILNWPAGRLALALTDPNGRTIDADVAEADPVVDYLELNAGFGLMASYAFSETVPGSWSYQLTALDDATFYRLAVVPPLPIAVTASVPDWTPASKAVPILASVTYDESMPLPGGAVVAEIDRADGLKDILTLYDDGAHDDGAAGDGAFGASYLPPAGGYYGLLLTASGDYNGEPYQRNVNRIFTVAPASAELSGQFSDRGFDENGDGSFDFLEVYATVKINQDGIYGLTAELFKGSTFISAAYTEVDLAADDFLREIAIRFPAIDIVAAQLDGPYTVRNVMLTDESDGTVLIAADDNVHTTASYRWSQFGQTPTATPTATPSPTPTGTPPISTPTPTPSPTPTATRPPGSHSLLLPLISGAP